MDWNFVRTLWRAWKRRLGEVLPTSHGRLYCTKQAAVYFPIFVSDLPARHHCQEFHRWLRKETNISGRGQTVVFNNENFESESVVFIVKCREKTIFQRKSHTWIKEGTSILEPQAKGYFNTPSYLAWAFQSGSPLKHDFDRVILRLTEVGLLVQGVLFYWSALKMTKYQTLKF